MNLIDTIKQIKKEKIASQESCYTKRESYEEKRTNLTSTLQTTLNKKDYFL